jgi:hypothetical protein
MRLEKSDPPAFPVHVKLINPWPFLWAVICAWMWYGALHLAHIV